jgi:hypothetical protein
MFLYQNAFGKGYFLRPAPPPFLTLASDWGHIFDGLTGEDECRRMGK